MLCVRVFLSQTQVGNVAVCLGTGRRQILSVYSTVKSRSEKEVMNRNSLLGHLQKILSPVCAVVVGHVTLATFACGVLAMGRCSGS
ncbi:hypothetical protein BDV34DRAFT_204045 [Aspergillus parasiticus]|uniref:Uncharacterized protein n=1 Tax=Aspergillus parasiticus TaxID=5067 RepID=A0A5N6D8T8_ASPPA|nr:hypothetical protein BDV34DRAFT_204045 [Aspergillus parasiticus]